jgi:hypothetical protein
MFAIAAVIIFVLAFILGLLHADTGSISLLFLGLACLAAHFAFGYWSTRRQP